MIKKHRPLLKLTAEGETNRELAVLDTPSHRVSYNIIKISLYMKPYLSGRFLHNQTFS